MNNVDFESTKHMVDGLSIGVLLGTIAELLPHLASLLTVIWMALRVWESPTVQTWRTRRKED